MATWRTQDIIQGSALDPQDLICLETVTGGKLQNAHPDPFGMAVLSAEVSPKDDATGIFISRNVTRMTVDEYRRAAKGLPRASGPFPTELRIHQMLLIQIGEIPSSSPIEEIAIDFEAGAPVLWGETTDSLWAFDISNPRRPRRINVFEELVRTRIRTLSRQAVESCAHATMDFAESAAIAGVTPSDVRLAYHDRGRIVLGTDEQLVVVDASQRGSLIRGGSVHLRGARRLVPVPLGNRRCLVFAGRSGGGGPVLDLTDIHAPREVGYYARRPWFVGAAQYKDLRARIGNNGRSVSLYVAAAVSAGHHPTPKQIEAIATDRGAGLN